MNHLFRLFLRLFNNFVTPYHHLITFAVRHHGYHLPGTVIRNVICTNKMRTKHPHLVLALRVYRPIAYAFDDCSLLLSKKMDKLQDSRPVFLAARGKTNNVTLYPFKANALNIVLNKQSQCVQAFATYLKRLRRAKKMKLNKHGTSSF